ncbi:MAG: hypothetical protein AAF711_05990 [Planctomycetota bacterium]
MDNEHPAPDPDQSKPKSKPKAQPKDIYSLISYVFDAMGRYRVAAGFIALFLFAAYFYIEQQGDRKSLEIQKTLADIEAKKAESEKQLELFNAELRLKQEYSKQLRDKQDRITEAQDRIDSFYTDIGKTLDQHIKVQETLRIQEEKVYQDKVANDQLQFELFKKKDALEEQIQFITEEVVRASRERERVRREVKELDRKASGLAQSITSIQQLHETNRLLAKQLVNLSEHITTEEGRLVLDQAKDILIDKDQMAALIADQFTQFAREPGRAALAKIETSLIGLKDEETLQKAIKASLKEGGGYSFWVQFTDGDFPDDYGWVGVPAFDQYGLIHPIIITGGREADVDGEDPTDQDQLVIEYVDYAEYLGNVSSPDPFDWNRTLHYQLAIYSDFEGKEPVENRASSLITEIYEYDEPFVRDRITLREWFGTDDLNLKAFMATEGVALDEVVFLAMKPSEFRQQRPEAYRQAMDDSSENFEGGVLISQSASDYQPPTLEQELQLSKLPADLFEAYGDLLQKAVARDRQTISGLLGPDFNPQQLGELAADVLRPGVRVVGVEQDQSAQPGSMWWVILQAPDAEPLASKIQARWGWQSELGFSQGGQENEWKLVGYSRKYTTLNQ